MAVPVDTVALVLRPLGSWPHMAVLSWISSLVSLVMVLHVTGTVESSELYARLRRDRRLSVLHATGSVPVSRLESTLRSVRLVSSDQAPGSCPDSALPDSTSDCSDCT